MAHTALTTAGRSWHGRGDLDALNDSPCDKRRRGNHLRSREAVWQPQAIRLHNPFHIGIVRSKRDRNCVRTQSGTLKNRYTRFARMVTAEIPDSLAPSIDRQRCDVLRESAVPRDEIAEVKVFVLVLGEPTRQLTSQAGDVLRGPEIEPALAVGRTKLGEGISIEEARVDRADIGDKVAVAQLTIEVGPVVFAMDLVELRNEPKVSSVDGETFEQTCETTPGAVESPQPAAGVVESVPPLLLGDGGQE
jgi:hypothetical protein